MIISSNSAAANILTGAPAPRGKSISQDSTTVDKDQVQFTSVSDQDLTAAGAPIQNEDEASNSTETARQMIIAQNTMAMMAQANSLPMSALRLLQQ